MIKSVSKKKKILLVHNFYQVSGGEDTVFENEYNLLVEKGHKVLKYTRSNEELKKSKLKLLSLPFTTVFSYKTYLEIKKIIKTNNIDIVHCHNTFPLISPSVYYAAIRCGVPVVQTIHNFRLLCPNALFYCNGKNCEKCNDSGHFWNAIRNKCYRNSAIQTMMLAIMLILHRCIGTYKKINYIFLTDFNKEKFSRLININNRNVFVKPNLVNKIDIKRERTQYASKFIYAGRLEKNKGIIEILDFWKKLPEQMELHIYGEGSLRESVKEKSAELGNVIYYGYRCREDIINDLYDSAALIFPSFLYEGFPMTIAESISIGCPIISTDLGNQGDIIKKSGAGAVYLAGNEESFVKAINDVLNNRDKYLQNCLNYYQDVLSSDKNYDMLIEIYDSIGER